MWNVSWVWDKYIECEINITDWIKKSSGKLPNENFARQAFFTDALWLEMTAFYQQLVFLGKCFEKKSDATKRLQSCQLPSAEEPPTSCNICLWIWICFCMHHQQQHDGDLNCCCCEIVQVKNWNPKTLQTNYNICKFFHHILKFRTLLDSTNIKLFRHCCYSKIFTLRCTWFKNATGKNNMVK